MAKSYTQNKSASSSGLSQANRDLSVTTPLGKDKLVFWRMSGGENLSRIFNYNLELLSEDGDIDLYQLLGQPVTTSVSKEDGGIRYFNGHVAHASYLGMTNELHHYQVILRPWLWFLSKSSDCRIFQKMTVPDIVKQVFNDAGFSDYEIKLSGHYGVREYCVQYRETSLNFVNRLLEHEGIYYYFRHDDGKHIMVLADSIGSHSSQGDIRYCPPDSKNYRKEEHINSWILSSEVQSGAYVTTDFDFKHPKTNLKTHSINPEDHLLDDREVYDYPGNYTVTSEGESYARVRLEELQANGETIKAAGNSTKISAGILFSLQDFPRADQNREYLVTGADYQLYSDDYTTSNDQFKDMPVYQCQFRTIARTRAFRPPRSTPLPFVYGPQTAVVVGPSGEEIYTDDHGRVKVQFHWDRIGKNNDQSSCWIRVSQNWAGKQWGGVFLPRIGQEVIVEFLEGDPDKPIITGSVYNGDTKPPYALPAKKTLSGIKSHSSKGGSDDNFNELRFEDSKGNEEVYFHAEKDFTRIVENNDTLSIGFEKKQQGDQTTDIYNNRTTTLEMGSDSLNIKQGNRTTTLDMGDHIVQIKSGNRTVNVDLGSITEEAMQFIEFKVGASSLKIEPTQVTIKSPQIALKADLKFETESTLTTVKGDALLVLEGSIIKIN